MQQVSQISHRHNNNYDTNKLIKSVKIIIVYITRIKIIKCPTHTWQHHKNMYTLILTLNVWTESLEGSNLKQYTQSEGES